MKQPLESKRPEASVGAANVPQPVTREDKAAARKAAKTDWNAGSLFPVASDPALWGKVVSAASRAGSTLDAALGLAQAGVPVFPVSSVGQKKPLNAHGVYSATIDPAVVARDFSPHSNALIGVPMGRRTGMFAIDVDASPPHAHDGVAAWRALEAKSGVTPTRIHMTATGGLHLLFCWPPERYIGCAVKGLPKGIECKGEGGSIIFPPSERSGGKYSVVSDVDPAHAPDWLLNLVAPAGGARAITPRVYPKTRVDAEGSPYGLKALDNACAKLASAGPGERDSSIGENVLAIGSLAAGGELHERHALQSLKRASQSNPGSDSSYWDKIERAFETGKEKPRTAPPKRDRPKSATKQWSNAPETMTSALDSEANDESCPSCPSYPHVLNQRAKEKKSASGFDELIEKLAELDLTKEDGVPAILAEAAQRRLPDLQTEMLIKALAKKAGVGVKTLRSLMHQSRAEVTATQPDLNGPAPCQLEEEEQRRRREVDDMREAIQESSSKITLSDTILTDMEAVVHGLGVVGESAAIRGAYLAATSRLLRNHAICLLRRGAAAGGKNFLLSTVFRLLPSESSSSSPAAVR
jgi:Bifunctional DNA primase/polymerase, N-terminal